MPTHEISLQRTKSLRLSALHVFRASRIQETPSADDVADEARAADFSDPLAVAQDVEDPVEALIHFQLGELLDVGLHDKKLAFRILRFLPQESVVEIPDRRVHGFQRLVQDLVLAHHGLVEVLNDGVNLIVRQAAFHVRGNAFKFFCGY